MAWGLGLLGPPLARAQCPSFQAPTTFPASSGTLVPADYDVDGNTDVAVGGVLLYGNGAGGFTAPTIIPGVRAMAAVDLGGVNPPIAINNAAPELVAESTSLPTRVAVGLGTGLRFQPFEELAGFPVWGSPPLSAAAADLNGDGIPDLVIGYGAPANVLVIWEGTTMTPNWGSAVAPVQIPFDDPVALAIGDFDDDGRPELLALSGHSSVLLEFKFLHGQFDSQSIPVTGGPTGMVVADLDGDGLLDVVVTTASGDLVSLIGNGRVVDHTQLTPPFGNLRRTSVGVALAGLALGDVNGDGRTDAVAVDTANGRLFPLLGDGTGAFTAGSPFTAGTQSPSSVALADLDHDGRLDVITGDRSAQQVAVQLNSCPITPVDLEVTGMEVTQGIQDLANSVFLVANRPTYVRVHVRAGAPIDGIIARLARTDGSGTALERPIWPSNPGGSITVKASPDRKVLADALLFELPPSWTAGGTLNLTATVNPDHLPVETRYDNNTASGTFSFGTTNPLKVELIKMKFHVDAGPPDLTGCNQDKEATDGDLDLAESALRREMPTASFVFTRSSLDTQVTLECTTDITLGFESGKLLDALKAAFASAPHDRIRLGIDERDTSGGVADAEPGWFAVAQYATPKIPPHEVGHTLGRFHVPSPESPPCSADLSPTGLDPSYPYSGGIIGGPSGNAERFMGFDPGDAAGFPWPTPQKVMGPTTGDLMGYCQQTWPSDYTWAGLRSGINAKFTPNDPNGDFLRVTGEIASSGKSIVNLAAVRLPAVGAIDPTLPGKYRLRLLDAGGKLLSELLFQPRPDHDGQPTLISETLTFVVGTRGIVVQDPRGVTLGTIAVSAHAPSVGKLIMSSGQSFPLRGPVTVSWSAGDADGDPLLADLFWSRDGGSTFEPIAVSITGSSYSFDPTQLPGTGGKASGVLRLLVRDPVLTASTELGGITAANRGPRVRILEPFAGQGFVRGQTLVLRATAVDPEDGVLDGAITWSSDVDGPLGGGASIATRLSIGSHLLSARVVDSSGAVTTATTPVRVFSVLPKGAPPLAVTGADQQVVEGATVALDGSASRDPDGDPLTYAWRVLEAPQVLPGLPLTGSGPVATFRAPVSGRYRFELTVSDLRQGTSTATVQVNASNVPPSVTGVSPASGSVLRAGPVTVQVTFSDPSPLDTHSCSVVWDEDTKTPPATGAVSESAHTCTAARTLSAGVYSVRISVRDSAGGEGVARTQLVVVDPTAGSVHGEGRFPSPHGAVRSTRLRAGNAEFELRSAYAIGASRPHGEIELHVGDLRFHDESQDWLVVTGSKAQVRGAGKVNGKAGFEVLVTAYDEDPRCGHGDEDERGHDERGPRSSHLHPGVQADRIRIKIWNHATGAVVYDNVRGAPDDIDSASPQQLSAGCITIVHPPHPRRGGGRDR